MTIIAKIRLVVDGIARARKRRPDEVNRYEVGAADSDGHAPGHRHLGPPPDEHEPGPPDLEPPKNKPWVRTTHSDSQTRRFRR